MKRTLFALTPGALIVWLLALAGTAGIIYRFWAGIGAVSNLTDGSPWGLWVAIDIMAGVALASGGFVVAGAAYLFGGKQFHSLARPAVLAAFLGYILFVAGLIVDMGRPWHMFYLLLGNHQSPLYEIGWCASLYTLVLFLELLPPVLEKFSMNRTLTAWRAGAPWLVVVILSVFTWAMTFSITWVAILAAMLIAWELLLVKGVMKRDARMPILLIAAGVILSCLHQSSLGTLFLMTSHKLHALWYTPLLPIHFLVSAIAAGIAMVTLESMGTERLFGHTARTRPLTALARIIPFVLALYILLKAGDLMFRHQLPMLLSDSTAAVMWWAEMLLGAAIPLGLYLSPRIIASRGGLFTASFLVVTGVILNRVNVAIIGVDTPRWGTYYPSLMEFVITLGIISMGLLAFEWFINNLPIHERA